MSESERDEFEKWAGAKTGWSLERDPVDGYRDDFVRLAWIGWQARAALALPAPHAETAGGMTGARWYAMALPHLSAECDKPCALHEPPFVCDIHVLDGMCNSCEARWLRNPQNAPVIAVPLAAAVDGRERELSCLVCGHVGERAVWHEPSGQYACVSCRDAGQAARQKIMEAGR